MRRPACLPACLSACLPACPCSEGISKYLPTVTDVRIVRAPRCLPAWVPYVVMFSLHFFLTRCAKNVFCSSTVGKNLLPSSPFLVQLVRLSRGLLSPIKRVISLAECVQFDALAGRLCLDIILCVFRWSDSDSVETSLQGTKDTRRGLSLYCPSLRQYQSVNCCALTLGSGHKGTARDCTCPPMGRAGRISVTHTPVRAPRLRPGGREGVAPSVAGAIHHVIRL